MNAVRLAVLSLAIAAAACHGSGSGDASYPSSPSSPYSASTSYSAPSMSGPGVPAREQVTAGIVVRPDLLCVPFALHARDADAEKAIASAQSLTNELAQKLRAIAPSGTMRMRGIAVAPASYGKSKDEPPAYALTADGAFEIPLTDAMDYWARSRLIAALVAATKKEHEARANQQTTWSFETPNLRVTDPEVHRAKLMKQWVERARAFADAAQSGLALVDCNAPGEVTQRSISTEEVALTLSIACRLDARAAK